jgi:hypothetical protein
MNLWGPAFYTNDALETEIRAFADMRRTVRGGNPAEYVRRVHGEGRLIEFWPVKESMDLLDADLREMMAEARRRGMPIGGRQGCEGGMAIDVEIGR